ncbi:hypothetical protein BWI15_05595 [Kribbella sp. ALI-6-A]|nr:hypothetical protein [Kribbella sp. ALI-6-A]ONI76758.1 hypothetical protein BWI15_05595 [Kribbella sp. ALI-6-A]
MIGVLLLVRFQLDRRADHLEFLAAVAADDQDLGVLQGTGDGADDRFDCVAVYLQPLALPGKVPAGGAFDDEAFEAAGLERFQPLLGLVDIGGDRRQLHRRRPAVRKASSPVRRAVQRSGRTSTLSTAVPRLHLRGVADVDERIIQLDLDTGRRREVSVTDAAVIKTSTPSFFQTGRSPMHGSGG